MNKWQFNNSGASSGSNTGSKVERTVDMVKASMSGSAIAVIGAPKLSGWS
jgi:hypothetical protein